MRFVRIYTRSDTGEVTGVCEQETPFNPRAGISSSEEVEMHELGLVEDFDPKCAITGARCSPARHLHQRIERAPSAIQAIAAARARSPNADLPIDPTATALSEFRVKPEQAHDFPEVMDIPTTLDGIKQRLRVKGPQSVSPKARAWLTLMLPPHEVEAMGIARGVPIAAVKASESLRTRRDINGGSRQAFLERAAQVQHEARRRKIERDAQRRLERERAAAARAARALEELERDHAAELESMHDTEGNIVDG